MMDELGSYDAAKITLVGEFAEHRCRGAPHRVLEIDGVGKIHSQTDTVNNKVEPFTELLIATLPEGKQHQQDIKCIGIDDG